MLASSCHQTHASSVGGCETFGLLGSMSCHGICVCGMDRRVVLHAALAACLPKWTAWRELVLCVAAYTVMQGTPGPGAFRQSF